MNDVKITAKGNLESKIRNYIILTKPGLTFVAVSTTAGGAFLGMYESGNYLLLIQIFIGACLAGAGAGVLNNYFERNLDARMTRTGLRPLPAKKISPQTALRYGVLLSLSGILFLIILTTIMAGVLTFITLFIYLAIYTPLKRITPLALYIGGIAGALPPLIGFAAVTNQITSEGLSLFLILFLWQIPHFLSLAWIHREDYKQAGYKVSSVVDPTGNLTGWQILFACVLLMPVSVLPAIIKSTSPIYIIVSFIITGYFLIRGFYFYLHKTDSNAKRIFSLSIIYIPVLFTTLIVDRIFRFSFF